MLPRDESPLTWTLADHYPREICEAEVRRYRHIGSAAGLRRLLAGEPEAVPLLGYNGSGCLGANHISWEGVRMDRQLAPGRLFAFFGRIASMMSQFARKQQTVLYLMAWQPPFPTHAIAAWGRDACLLPGPVAVEESVRQLAGWMFHTGAHHSWGPRERARQEWLKSFQLAGSH